MDFTITKREILVCIAITFILIGIGFLISSSIQNAIYEDNEKYYKALKIEDSEEQFKHAIQTNIGYTLAQGKVTSVEGIHIEDIEGTYYRIRKVKEKYTMHTREVSHTRTKSDGTTETYYTTEEYWTWDYAGEEEFHTEKFNFLGVDFDYGTINFYNEKHKETKSGGYHIRYQYYVIPFEFKGTLFSCINNNTINENNFYIENSIENIINSKQKDAETWSIGFWIIWIILIGLIDFGFVYMENKYLED